PRCDPDREPGGPDPGRGAEGASGGGGGGDPAVSAVRGAGEVLQRRRSAAGAGRGWVGGGAGGGSRGSGGSDPVERSRGLGPAAGVRGASGQADAVGGG